MLRLLLVFSVVVMFHASLAGGESRNDPSQLFSTKEQVESFVKNEIPIGAKRDQVTGILERYGLLYSYVPQDRMIGAITKDVKKSLLISESIQMKFYFDENDRFQSYSVKSVYTGP
jgi:hypothetical protein